MHIFWVNLKNPVVAKLMYWSRLGEVKQNPLMSYLVCDPMPTHHVKKEIQRAEREEE
jgi:hypothetical protein